MFQRKKLFALVLAFMLVLSGFGTFAESGEVVSELIDSPVGLATDFGDTGLSGDAELPEPVVDNVPEIIEEPSAPQDDAADYVYARLVADVAVASDGLTGILPENAIVLYLGGSTAAVAVAETEAVAIVDIDASALELLDYDETLASFDADADQVFAAYADDLNWPLPLTAVAAQAAPEAEAEPAEAEAPEEAEIPEAEDEAPLAAMQAEAGEAEAGITFPAELTLGVKEAITPAVAYTPVSAEDVLTFASENAKIAKVDAKTGKITGVKAGGPVNITVTSKAGATATCAVTVKKAPSKVTLNLKKATLGEGQTIALTATLPSNSASQITWSTSNAKVATVDQDGVVTAVATAKKTVTITAKTFNKKTAKFVLTVKPAPTGVTIPETLKLCVDQVYALDAVLAPKDAVTELTYVSSDESVVAVEGNVLTAKALGDADITVTAHNGITVTSRVSVIEGPTSVEVANPIEALGVKEKYALTARIDGDEDLAIFNTWTSKNAKVLKVDAQGNLTGVKAGTTDVTVTTANGLTDTITVKVAKAPSKVTLSAKKATLGEGQQLALTATLPKNTASRITWTSSAPDYVSVDENGVVTVLKASAKSVTITAKTFNKKTAKCVITAKAAPTALTVREALALGEGQKYTLATALEPAAAAAELTFVSSDESVVTVEDGKLTAVSGGTADAPKTATVTVTTHNGLEAVCEVSVYPAPTEVTIPNAVKSLGVKETFQLVAATDSNDALLEHATWKTSNAKVLKVDAQGLITGVKAGTAKITVTTANGKKVTVSITVAKAPASVTLSEKAAVLQIGETLQLTATLPKSTASQITWTSSNPAVATVEDGLVTATGSGEAVITAATFNGKTAECVVTVEGIGVPAITIDGKAAGETAVEVYDSVALGWSSTGSVLSYAVQVTGDDDKTVLSESATSDTAATIDASQLTSGVTYTVTVSATPINGDADGVTTASAQFKYIDLTIGFVYEVGDSGAVITGYTGDSKSLIVPAKLGGAAVTRIATGAFNGENCAAITSITWPTGVVFEENSVAGLTGCADADGFLVFDGTLCEYFGSASTVTIPAGVVRVNDGAFAGNEAITTVNIPNGVTVIGVRAFANCTNLSTMQGY